LCDSSKSFYFSGLKTLATIIVLKQGIRFAVAVDGPTRGYILEVFDNHFVLPNLGPIGANGLANPRDFLTPAACYEHKTEIKFKIYNKYQGLLFEALQVNSSIF
jgi:homogentisate 1,2-dioxygenase